MGTGGRAGGGVDTPHCTGAPAPNGPLVHTPNASPPGGANPPAGVEAPAVNIPASQWPRSASRKATARISSRGDKEPLRPLFHNPSREPGSVIAPHNSAPARTTVTHFVHLPRECGALPSPPRRGGAVLQPNHDSIVHTPHASPPGHARPPPAVEATSANHTRVLRDTRGLRRRWRLRFQRSRLSVRWRGFASPAAAYQDGAQRFPRLRKWLHTPVAVRGGRPP